MRGLFERTDFQTMGIVLVLIKILRRAPSTTTRRWVFNANDVPYRTAHTARETVYNHGLIRDSKHD